MGRLRSGATRRAIGAMWALTGSALLLGQGPPRARFDILLRHGTILDGTGSAPLAGDVGISGGSIARVGDLARATAGVELDAGGLYVAPGFINLHSHASAAGLGTAENMLTQGVTTEILNPDGGGPLDIAAQLAEVKAAGLAINAGASVGFNRAWASVVGESDRRPSIEEIDHMRAIIVSNLERGAWGVSAGLDYKPAYFATAGEVADVVKAAGPWRTVFTNHDRLTPETNYSSRVAVAETIDIARRAGLVPVVTHMKVQGHEQGTAATVLGLMDDATARGTYTAADAYPYLAGQSGLGALIIPGWAQDGGRERMIARFTDPALRSRIAREAEAAMTARLGGPGGVYVTSVERELTDVMREMNAGAGEAVIRLLETESMGAILRFGSEPDLVRILQHPTTSVACDCGAVPPGRASHPRYYGTYPRVLGRYVRDTGALTWADAVRKMTLLPAATIGMIDRGAIAPGLAADITVFDPNTIIDHATFEQPTLASAGIRHVIVNGGLALQDGVPTGRRHGATLLRTRLMPSRPTGTDVMRRASGKGRLTTDGDGGTRWFDVAIDVSQRAGGRAASGSVTLTDRASKRVIRAEEIGLLQVSAGWATVSARGRVPPSNEERTIVVIVDLADSTASGPPTTMVVMVDGTVEASGTVTGRWEIRR